MSHFPTRHPYSLGIFLNQIERIMAAWIAELPVRIHYGCVVTGFAQDDSGVDLRLSDGEPLRARYLVGCDGGRSLIRKAAGGWSRPSSSSGPPASRPCAISAKRSSPSTAATSGSTTPPGSPGSRT
jgi:2-polyprenyl-6-methoxyphenol hydroxylase-like FAD-dependent oxidoreductase